MEIEWVAILKTENEYIFNLILYASNRKNAMNKAKKMCKRCPIISLKETNQTGVRNISYLMA